MIALFKEVRAIAFLRIGVVKTYEILPSVPVKNVTISKRADSWYVSFKYDYEQPQTPKSECDPASALAQLLRRRQDAPGSFPCKSRHYRCRCRHK
ncbi:hypothetical protein [Dapis sp. BLCC M229]|uniref:hypothetical protein n=1 Tax=Dapis sp. BLCC M229 TaxID=3400188 RepID=UPI003CF52A74